MNHIEEPPPDFLAWVDTETTGLDPPAVGYDFALDFTSGAARVIDLSVIITDAHLVVVDEFNTKIKLTPIDRANFHPAAMAANGYTDKEWAGAPANSREIWDRVFEMTRDRPIYGQNVPFDIKFLESEMARYRIKPKWDRRIGDTQLLSQRAKHAMGLRNAKLETAYPAMGGPELPPHRARPDVLRSMYLYWRMVVSRDGLSDEHEKTASDNHFTKILARAAEEHAASKAVAKTG